MSITRLRSRSITPAAAALATVLVALGGCGEAAPDGPRRSETRPVGEFQAIELRGAADAVIRVGQPASLTVSASDEALRNLTAEVRNGTLVVEQKGAWFLRTGAVDLQISLPQLREVTVNGAGDVRIESVQGESLRLALQGAGNLTAQGEVHALNATINGAGNVDLRLLSARTATVAVNGAGNLTVHAADALEAVVNGVGSVHYLGSPAKLGTKVNGVGRISAAPPASN